MNNAKPIPKHTSSSGFTLLEILISLLVFAIGLLGLAGMQTQGLKYSHDAYMRSQATLLAYDLLDRMRANVNNAAFYVMNEDPIVTVPSSCVGSSASCSNANMVLFDKYEWKKAIETTLPNAKGSVVSDTDNTSPQHYIITVKWNTDRTNPATVATFTLRSSL